MSVNIILFIYRRCSIWPPPTSLHFVYRLVMSCRTLETLLSIISRTTTSATCIRATRCCVSTRVLYTRVFMYIRKWKSNDIRSDERGDQSIGPPHQIYLLPKVSFNWRHKEILKREYKWQLESSVISRESFQEFGIT